MFFSIGLFLGLVFIGSGKETLYPFLNFSDVKPYDEIPCPTTCRDTMKKGFALAVKVFGTMYDTTPMSINFCQECIRGGLDFVHFDHICFKNPENDVFDHHVLAHMPLLYVNCTCNLSNIPSSAANKLNAGNLVVGECGKEKAQNKLKCEPIKCQDNTSGSGESMVKLAANLPNAVVHTIYRIDTREGNPGAYQIMGSLLSDTEIPVIYEGPPEFHNTWECLEANKEAVVCHLLANYPITFFDCLSRPAIIQDSLVHSIIYEYGKCSANSRV